MSTNPANPAPTSEPFIRLLLIAGVSAEPPALQRFIEIERLPYTVQVVPTVALARPLLAAQTFDLILLDQTLSEGTELEWLREAGTTPVVFLTGTESPDLAVAALQKGATDYLLKDREQRYLRLLPVVMERTVRRTRERQALQARLQRTQRTEALGTLAGGIAHEFNNLLAIILSYAELSKLECDNCPGLEANQDEVIKAAWRAKDLVQQIQNFNLEQPDQREPVKLEQVVKDACQLLRNAIPRNVQIDATGVSAQTVVVAPQAKLQQAFLNLCNNAWQALPAAGGRIQICSGNIAVDASNTAQHGNLVSGRYVQLSVQDNGSGMDAATLARALEPGFTTRPAGSGLGLAVVAELMRAQGGSVLLRSKPGAGTTAHLYFPIAGTATPSPPPARPKELSPASSRRRIMLIDDEAGLLLVNGKFLTRMGHEVVSFDRAEPALATVQEATALVDLIITDFNMPGLDGLALLEAVRQVRPQLPFILMTGYADETLLARATAMAGVTLLQKPVLAAQLGEAVQKALSFAVRPAAGSVG